MAYKDDAAFLRSLTDEDVFKSVAEIREDDRRLREIADKLDKLDQAPTMETKFVSQIPPGEEDTPPTNSSEGAD